MATHSSSLAWEIPRREKPGQSATVCEVTGSDTTQRLNRHHHHHTWEAKVAIFPGIFP